MKKKQQQRIIKLPDLSKFKKRDLHFNASALLLIGVVITCIVLSISSGFVDLAHFSGLSKSVFHIASIPLAAAFLYTLISIGFISAKFWCAMQIGMLRELRTRLEVKNKTWAPGLKKAEIPWQIAHKFLVAISLWTALSLSINSIGTGIRLMEQNIKNMSADANQLIILNNSVNEGVQDKRKDAKDTITGKKEANDTASSEVKRYVERLKKYQDQYWTIADDETLTEEEKVEQQEVVIAKIVKEIPGTSARNAIYFSEADLKKSIQKTATANEVIDSSSIYEEGIEYDKAQIEELLKAIMDKEYRTPDGEIIQFVNEDGSLINVQLAVSRLQNAISKWQVDTGDVGESSRIYTLLASYIHADSKAGGMGTSEFMMMIFIAFIGIAQEFLIYLFTPKANIDRRVLSWVSHYLKWENEEEKERFLISVYISYAGDGILNQKQFDEKCKEAVYYMELKEEDIIAKYSKHKKIEKKPLQVESPIKEGGEVNNEKLYSDKVDKLVGEIKDLTKDL